MKLEQVIATAKAGETYIAPSRPEIAFTSVQNPFLDSIEWIRFKNLPTIKDSIVDAPANFTSKDFRYNDYELVVKP